MFGECCFHPGDAKLTMGTGGFWNVNTGERLFASWRGKLVKFYLWSISLYLTAVDDKGIKRVMLFFCLQL